MSSRKPGPSSSREFSPSRKLKGFASNLPKQTTSMKVSAADKPWFDLIFCIPVYDDWESTTLLLGQLARVVRDIEESVCVVLVDDGSTASGPGFMEPPRGIDFVDVVHLRCNVGHQRAIALGLCHIHTDYRGKVVIVMDGDGEDAPGDVPRLLERCERNGRNTIVFGKRTRRSESLVFRAGYHFYRLLHLLLTGRRVEVGNFSAIPFGFLDRIIGIPEMWNHYAAAVIHARLPIDMVPAPRHRRLAGKPKMNYVGLILHGMSGISVYAATIGARLLCMSGLLSLFTLAGILALVAARWLTPIQIPGWAPAVVGFLTIVLLNLIMLSTLFVLLVLQSRNEASFIPVRDWTHYVASTETLRAVKKSA